MPQKRKEFSDALFNDSNTKRYHQPSEEFREDWRFDGRLQTLDIAFDIAMRISNEKQMPRYEETEEFAVAEQKRSGK